MTQVSSERSTKRRHRQLSRGGHMALVEISRRRVADGADVATITLNRPEKKNAMNGPLQGELVDALREVSTRATDRAVVLTGAAGNFSSGGDLWGAADDIPKSPLHGMHVTGSITSTITSMHKPVIAKVRGYAVGAGCNIALACDLVVASDNAKFSEIFVKRGLIPDAGGTWLLPRRVGMHRAKEIAFFGGMYSAADALELGLINRVVADSELDAYVDDWSDTLAQGPPLALGITKQLLNSSLNTSLEQALDSEAVAQVYMFNTRDAQEAIGAFVEKRTPTFKGQ